MTPCNRKRVATNGVLLTCYHPKDHCGCHQDHDGTCWYDPEDMPKVQEQLRKMAESHRQAGGDE